MTKKLRTETLRKKCAEIGKSKKPKSNHKYIGVEIECMSPLTAAALKRKFAETGLERHVNLGYDSSISEQIGKGYEIRVLATQQSIRRVLEKTCSVLIDSGSGVDTSCGLHVHLDCRYRDPDRVYWRLVNALPFLTSLVAPSRKENDFCYVNGRSSSDKEAKYRAINYSSFSSRKTVEVRLHHGSLNAPRIADWIELLILIISAARPRDWPYSFTEITSMLRMPDNLQAFCLERLAAFAGLRPSAFGVPRMPEDKRAEIFPKQTRMDNTPRYRSNCHCESCKAERRSVKKNWVPKEIKYQTEVST